MSVTNNETSLVDLIKWLILAIVGGTTGSAITKIFILSYNYIINILENIPYILIIFWPVLGAIICGLVLYKISPKASGEGIPSYLYSVNNLNGVLKIKPTIIKLFASLTTLATFGNGGIVGPLGRVSAGLSSFICQKTSLIFDKKDIRTAAICGMSGAIGSIFHSSIGAGILSVEILQNKEIKYKDIFPAIIASSVAVFFNKSLNWKPFYNFNVPDKFMELNMVSELIILCIISGILGNLYVKTYSITTKIFNRSALKTSKLIVGSFVAAVIAYSINPEILGTSRTLIKSALLFETANLYGNFEGILTLPIILILSILVKILCNCITVGSGMSAGFTGPAAICGILLGASFALLYSIPPNSATYFTFIAAGFCGVLSSAMNIPLAAAIMTIELFGIQYSLAAGLASVIAFQTNQGVNIYRIDLKQKSSISNT